MLVRFLKRWRNYNGDEIAEFDDAMSQSIIASGFAVMFDPEAEEAQEEDAGQADGLPVQGGDDQTLAGGQGDASDTVTSAQDPQPEAESRKRGGKAETSALPVQGVGAETVAGGDGAGA